MLEYSLPIVFGAGILSFLSPCVLPLVPPYLTYMGGTTFDRLQAEGAAGSAVWWRTVLTSAFFILGFSTIFVGLGATATVFGQFLRAYLPLLAQLAGVVIIAMGLHFLGVFRLAFVDRQVRFSGPSLASGPAGGYLLGLAFALGWTPCIGPILAAILPVAATADTAWQGAGLLAVYSAGLGVPFLLAALALGPFMGFFERFRRHLGTVEKIMGVFLVATGLLFISGNFTRISYWLLEAFPVLQRFG
jgi:cytochrome c-type biogenesis protein